VILYEQVGASHSEALTALSDNTLLQFEYLDALQQPQNANELADVAGNILY
jgi:hypothetical protein